MSLRWSCPPLKLEHHFFRIEIRREVITQEGFARSETLGTSKVVIISTHIGRDHT